jgi:hypothetical protein
MLLIGGIFKLAFGKNVAALGSIWLDLLSPTTSPSFAP